MKKYIPLMMLAFGFSLANAQNYDYEFTKDTKAYDYLSGATLLNTNFSSEDTIHIPFVFAFYGDTVSTVYVRNSQFYFEGNPDRGGSPYRVDLSKNDSGGIYYLTEGEVGERVLKIDWRNAILSDSDIPNNDSVNFQVWLYELTNTIEFHYGICHIDSATYENIDGFCFIRNNNKTIYAEISPSDPYIHKNDTTNLLPLDTFPLSGLMYKFSTTDPYAGIKNTLNANRIKVFPNPFDENIFIQTEEEISDVKICNTEGKCLLKSTGNELNTAGLPPGIYIIQVNTKKGMYYQKILKQ